MVSPVGETRPVEPTPAPAYGEVFDLGYRHYDGRREGRGHAIRSLIVYSIKRGLGLKKHWTSKILPFVLYGAAFVPVIIVVGIRAYLGPLASRVSFSYFDLLDMTSMIILVFAAATAPEMLCDDRRQHVLHLYFSRAIRRLDYLLAKIGALGFLVGAIAFLPGLLLFLGNCFLDASPFWYFVDHAGDLGRILAAGAVSALFYSSVALVVAAYMDRKGTAAATAIGAMLIGSVIVSAVFETVTAEWRRYVVLANPILIPQGTTRWIFGATSATVANPQIAQAGLDGFWYLVSVGVMALVCGFVMYRRYLSED